MVVSVHTSARLSASASSHRLASASSCSPADSNAHAQYDEAGWAPRPRGKKRPHARMAESSSEHSASSQDCAGTATCPAAHQRATLPHAEECTTGD